MTSYIEDILDQPAALQTTLEGLSAAEPLSIFAARLSEGRYRRVILTGMGSSQHVLQPLLLRLLANNLTALAVETSELIHYTPALLEPASLIVAVSQSGESVEVVRMLEKARGKTDVIGVTNSPASTLAQQAKAVVLTQAGPETSVSCKTYLASLTGLCWLGDQLVGDPASSQFPALAQAPRLAAQYLSRWREHVERLKAWLVGMQSLFLLGRGASLAAAYAGALIIKESSHTPAEGMSSAAFRHGPLEMVDEHTRAIVFTGSPETAGLNEKLAQDIRLAGGQAGAAGMSEGNSPFDLPSGPEPVLPVLEMLPAQMTSLALAELKGHEAGKFVRLLKVTTSE